MLKTHSVTQGDSFFVKIQLIDEDDGVPLPVFGWEFIFTVKRNKGDPDSAAIIQKKTTALQIVQQDPVTAYVVGQPADTKGAAPGRCYFDIQAKSPGGEIYTTEQGYFQIVQEITQIT